MKSVYALIASTLLSTSVFAQQQPPALGAPAPGDGPPPAREDGPPPPRDRGPGGPGGPGGPREGAGPRAARLGGPDGPGPGGGPAGDEPRMRQFEALRGYLDIVDRFARMTRDPSMSGIAAVVSAGDILKPRGTDASIDYFNKLLPEVKNPAVQRAIRVQLVELYKQSGKQDQALEQLKTLITADTSGEPAAPTPPPPPGAGAPRR